MTAPDVGFSGPELCRKTAREVVDLLRRKEISPAECIDASVERISQVEDAVNAMPIVCEDRAREAAADIGAVPDNPEDSRAWLAGLPIGIKDLTAVEGVRMTMGTPAMADHVAVESDLLVKRLERRGGVVIGKTNTPEMGAGGNTFNAVLGQTRNPWDTRKNAGGSSGGAAVSLATGEVWLSHGSDLAGSLRTPAGYCGVVGLRPSPGRAGGGPATLVFANEGVQGPMARNVDDLTLFLDAMSGFEPSQPLTIEAPAQSFQGALESVSPNVRIAFSPGLNGFAPVEAEIEAVMRAGLEQVQAAGAVVEEACPNLPDLFDTYVTLRATFWASLSGRLPRHVQDGFKQTLWENIDVGRKLTVEQVQDAQIGRSHLFTNMYEFLQGYDVLACGVVGLEPGMAQEEFPTSVAGVATENYIGWLRLSFLATATGLPAIALPIGFTASGMPVGIQLIGPPRGEAKLLQVAKALETAVDLARLVPMDPVVRH
ncbi:MAG: amidase family protein [Pseudomonadota bacterium]